MRKSILLRRIILLVLTAVIVSGLLSAGIYIFVTQQTFVQMRADELMPIARSLSEMFADVQQAGISGGNVILSLRNNKDFLGALLHVYDSQGQLIMNSQPGTEFSGNFQEYQKLSQLISSDLQHILKRNEVSGIRKSPDGQSYLVVGVPIQIDDTVTGAVIFTKPMSELSETMNGLNLTLVISTLVAFLVMLIPSYYAAKRLAVPIRQMGDVARAMAKGDFSVRANEKEKGEIGALGQSINHFAEQSEQLEQTRRDYVANVSHELRTPIASIRAMGETLQDGMVKGEEKQSLYYGNIVRESMRLSRLVDDLLQLSRLQSGTAALQKSRFDLREVIRNMADIYSYTAKETGLRFLIPVNTDEILPVFSNPDRIEQVLVILLDNAIKHTTDGSITLSITQLADHVELQVSDTGEGIPPEDLPHIFERFYKVDKSHSGGGTGLGLSIAWETLQGLGEKIRVMSSPRGTQFTFTIHKN